MKGRYTKMMFMHRSLRFLMVCLISAGTCFVSMSASAEATKSEATVEKAKDTTKKHKNVLKEAKEGPKAQFKWFEKTVPVEEIERTETAIHRLSQLVRNTPASNEKRAQYMFRLAELYTERTQYYEQRAFKRRDKAFLQKDKNPARSEAYKQAAKGDLDQSRNYARKAASLYGNLYKSYRDSFDEMDAVLYYLGSNFLQYNKPDAATQIFEELARSYPTSDYLPQAMLELGEISFNAGELDKALNYYNVVIQSPENPAYPYALYKKAWVLYNQADSRSKFKNALNVLYAAVEESKKRQEEGKGKLSLVKQARRDLPLFYSEVYKGKVAAKFFDKITPEHSDELLQRLAYIYSDQAKYDDGNAVLHSLIARNPKSFRIVGWQTQIVNNTRPGSTDVETVRETRRLVKLYKTALDFDDVTPELKAETSKKIEDLLRLVATTFHHQAQVTHNDKYYALAYNLYSDYIKTFPEGQDAYTMWFYYAELLFRNEDWAKAAEAYAKVLSLGDGKGKFAADAGYAQCLSYTKMVDLQPAALGTNDELVQDEGELPPIPQPKPIPTAYTRMMQSCDAYLNGTNDAELATQLDYVLAFVFYEYNHFDEAVKRFGNLALQRDDIDHKRATAAADLLLDSLALQRKWGEMREWIGKLQKSKLNKGDFGVRLATLREQVSFRECEDEQDAKDYKKAAYCFYDFVNNNAQSQFVDKAILNAAISFRKIDNLDYSISLLEQLPKLAPDSPLVPNTLYELGRDFHKLAIYDTAADNYEAYVEAAPDGEHVINAINNAARFRMGLGQYTKAIDDLKRFQRFAAKDDDLGTPAVAQAEFSIAEARDKRGDGSSAIRAYDHFVRHYRKVKPSLAVQALARQGDMYAERNDADRSFKKYQDAVDMVEKMDEKTRAALTVDALDSVSRSAFRLADRIFKTFQDVDINKKDAKELQAAVTEKMEIGQKATKAFTKIINVYKRPGWQIAALTRIGEINHSFFKQLLDTPIPDGLKPMVAEKYRTILEDQAAKVKVQAMDFYHQAIQVARKTGWFNEYSALAAKKLQALDPSFASGSEIRVAPGFDSARPYLAGYVDARAQFREQREDAKKDASTPAENPGKAAADEDAEQSANGQSATSEDSAPAEQDAEGAKE